MYLCDHMGNLGCRYANCLRALTMGNFCYLFQGGFSQDVSKNQGPHMVCSSNRSQLGYSKALASRSHYALRFPVAQQSDAKSIRYRRMACVNSTENNVSVSFKMFGLGICLEKL